MNAISGVLLVRVTTAHIEDGATADDCTMARLVRRALEARRKEGTP